MMTRKAPYFKSLPLNDGRSAPPPLSCTVERAVRFEEVDSLGIMWHGRYPSYFEDGRVAFGKKFGFGYLDVYGAGLIIPLKHMSIDYIAPLRYGDRCRITASLHWTEAARLDFSYTITDLSETLLTTGYTVQLFLTTAQELCMVKPDYYNAFSERWLAGMLPALDTAD